MLKITGLQNIDGLVVCYSSKRLSVYYFIYLFNSYYERRDEAVIRMPVQYNNTKLMDFISENKYKIKNPWELQKIQTLSKTDQCCSIRFKSPCSIVKPPPDLYKAIENGIQQNSCPFGSASLLQKDEEQVNHVWKGNSHQMKISFKVLINSFKLSFNLQKSR